jgi:hypothetical protein
MNVTIADEDCYSIAIALKRMEELKNSRSFQLEVLYITLKNDDPTDSIIQTLAILDKAEINQRKLYATLVKAHSETVNALPSKPPIIHAQQIFLKSNAMC